MITYTDHTVTETICDEMFCDRCKMKIGNLNPQRIPENSMQDDIEIQESFSLKIHGGYGSDFGDGRIVAIDLCQACLYHLIGDYVRYEEEDE